MLRIEMKVFIIYELLGKWSYAQGLVVAVNEPVYDFEDIGIIRLPKKTTYDVVFLPEDADLPVERVCVDETDLRQTMEEAIIKCERRNR